MFRNRSKLGFGTKGLKRRPNVTICEANLGDGKEAKLDLLTDTCLFQQQQQQQQQHVQQHVQQIQQKQLPLREIEKTKCYCWDPLDFTINSPNIFLWNELWKPRSTFIK